LKTKTPHQKVGELTVLRVGEKGPVTPKFLGGIKGERNANRRKIKSNEIQKRNTGGNPFYGVLTGGREPVFGSHGKTIIV